MRLFPILAAAVLACVPNIAKADEEICFINNSASSVSIYIDYEPLYTLAANSGDRNTCHYVAALNGTSGTGDSAASYLDMTLSTDGAVTESLIYSSPTNAFEMSTMPGVSQLNSLRMSFLNPLIGTGSFYFANPWGGVTQDIPNSELEWAENTLVCNKANKVCRYWARGNDSVYRVYFQDMQPTGYTKDPDSCESPLSPCYNG